MVTVRHKASLGSTHYQNAQLFRDKAQEIESIFENQDSIPGRRREEHRAYCFNTIFSTVGFLEATANEFVENVREDQNRIDNGKDPHHYPNLNKNHRNKIYSEGNLDNRVSGASPPIKYNVILDIVDINGFDDTQDPLEPTLVLNRLRNELTHFSPEWVEGGPKKYTQNEYGFEQDLKGRFDLNPLTGDGNAFFPSQCMSYGCAEWAVRYSRALVHHFSNKLGIDMNQIQ